MKKRLRGLLSLWLTAALLCSMLAVPAAAAGAGPTYGAVLYTGFDTLTENDAVYDMDYQTVSFQADTSFKTLLEQDGWKANTLLGWRLWTATSGDWELTGLTLLGNDQSENPDASMTQEEYAAIDADCLVLEPVLPPYQAGHVYQGTVPYETDPWPVEQSELTGILLNQALNGQEHLMGYVSPPVGHVLTGWKLWNTDSGGGLVGNIVPGGVITAEQVTDIHGFKMNPSFTLLEPVLALKYWFTQQPTAGKDYTVEVNEPEGVTYAWYPIQVYDVVDHADDSGTQIGVEPESDYGPTPRGDYRNGVWNAAGDSEDSENYTLIQFLSVQAGDTLTINTTGVINDAMWSTGGDPASLTKTDTGYTFTAGENMPGFFFGLMSETASFTATVTVTRPGQTPVTGQTTETFTGTESGTYVCKATFPEGVTLTSDPVAYTYTAPALYTVSVSVKKQPPYCKNDEIFLMADVRDADSGAAMTTGEVQFYKGDAKLGEAVSYSPTSGWDKQKGFALSVICGSSNFIPELSVGENIIKAVYTPTTGAAVTSEPFTVIVSDKENGNKYISSMTTANCTGDGVNYVSPVQFGVSNNGGDVGIKASEFVITGTKDGQAFTDFQVDATDKTATVKVKDPGTYVFTAKLPENSDYVGIEVSAPVKVLAPYTVTYMLDHLTAADQPTKVNYGKTLSAILTAEAGYKLPASISVTMGGTALELNGDTGYTYNSATGAVGIAHVTGNLVITATGVPKSTDATLSALSYSVGGGTATEVPGFAADTLTYNVTLPAGTAADAAITLTGTPATGASITTNAGVTLSDGSGTATLIITAEDGTTTKTYTVNFVTQPAAPAATEAVINYKNETISFADTYEMNTAADFKGTAITTGSSLTAYISAYGTAAQTLYIRVKAADETPASAATALTIPARPDTPAELTVTAGTNTLTVTAVSGAEYTVGDWSASNTTGAFTGLNPGTTYTVKARMAATAEHFKSGETAKAVRTLTALTAPTGTEADKGSVSADKTMAVGDTVTYTVTFTDGYTPTLTLSGNNNALSGPVKGENNTWTYTYTAHEDDKTVGAAVTFAERQVKSISYTGEPVTLFADSEHNATADVLKAYLAANVKVTPTYDNGTTGEAVAASYELKTGTWTAQGGSYIYTARAEGRTCDVPVTVKAVNAAIGPVDGITKTKTAEGYTTHAALGLPETVAVTYTGEDYTTRTGTLPVSWSDIPTDFGKNPGSNNFTGTVILPAWATGGNTTTATVTISNKTALMGDQMTLTMDGWTYGEEAKTPQGSVTVTEDSGGISYQYSADNGGT